ncbi:MAG: iron chelate uptake ABC transporter family permease subunit [Opitutales bacterium]
MARLRQPLLLALVGSGLGALPLQAARIGDLGDLDIGDQVLRFLSFQDPAVRTAVAGAVLIGVCCGMLGSFIVVRKLALVGDTLSHAVLPGVALGFLWGQTKDPTTIFIGAVLAGVVGVLVVQAILQTTHLKEDSALGLVLSGFYAIGIVLFTMIQRMPLAGKSGIDSFLFGQAAALSMEDIQLMAVVTAVSGGLLLLCYKEFLVTSFDTDYARAVGVRAQLFHYLLLLLLAFAVTVSIQASGVVLVSAMLITPAATAYMLTDRMHRLIGLAILFGILSGLFGTFFSFLENDLPTGPFMVMGATLVFVLALFLGPRYGVLPRLLRRYNRDRLIREENTLRAFFQVQEGQDFREGGVRLADLASRRNEPLTTLEEDAALLVKTGLATWGDSRALSGERRLYLTPEGNRRAYQMVRNHRLWELYLTHAADYPADHVHEDADKIEHILGEATVNALEKRLGHPHTDPHGRLIPSQEDMESLAGAAGFADPRPQGLRNPDRPT